MSTLFTVLSIIVAMFTVINFVFMVVGFVVLIPFKVKLVEDKLDRIETNHLPHLEASVNGMGQRIATIEGTLRIRPEQKPTAGV